MSSKTKTNTREVVVDQAEVRAINEAADYVTEQLSEFHDRHGVAMPVPKEQMRDHQALLILRGQRVYRAALVDGQNRVQHELNIRFHFKNGGNGGYEI